MSRGLMVSSLSTQADILESIGILRPSAPRNLILRRIGGDGDGGYLLPDDLRDVAACLSPGVDYSANFESELQCLGIESHLIDFSVDGPPSGFRPASFTKKFLGASTNGHFVTLSDWISGLDLPGGDLILQIDVEGAEYEVILDTPRHILDRCRVIVMELHNLDSLGNRAFLKVFKAFARKLTLGHRVVHLHPNNVLPAVNLRGIEVPPILEVTLLRNDRVARTVEMKHSQIPHPLDQPNVKERSDVSLSEDWL